MYIQIFTHKKRRNTDKLNVSSLPYEGRARYEPLKHSTNHIDEISKVSDAFCIHTNILMFIVLTFLF